MPYHTFMPPPSLAPFVRCFWALEGEAAQTAPYVHRTMASGCPELVFHFRGRFDEMLEDGKTEKSFVSGLHAQTKRYNRFVIREDFGIFGAYLYPYAIPQLFAYPAEALTNEMPDLQTLLGQEGVDLEEQMALASCHASRLMLLATYLERKLIRNYKADDAVAYTIQRVIHASGDVNIDALADDNFLSRRQFERKFKVHAGFSPRLFSRIVRFQSSLEEYGQRNKSLTEIAYGCGYFDQSHFIHDFREFSGYHPGYYFSGKAEGVEYRDA